MEELSFDNILGEQDIETLFTDPEPTAEAEEAPSDESPASDTKNDETKETTEAVDPDSLFGEEEAQPESVGSGKGKEAQEEEDAATEGGSDTSPNENFYSSIANALAVDGIFPYSDEDAVKKVTDAESFSELVEAEINARLTEKQQRVAKALDNGVEMSDIRKYENTLQYIASITDAAIAEESEQGENLRRNLIYQDFLNKGYSPEKAQKFTARTIDAGTDVEDAKEALQSNREYFQTAYNKLLAEAQQEADAEKAERVKQANALKESILKDKNLFGDMEITSDLRKKVFDNISKPIYRDPETGEYLTALQKYEMENRSSFLKYAGLIFTLTNGFTDFESFTKGKVSKEVKKGLRELEQVLNNTKRNSNGSLKMVTGVQDDPESYISKGMRLDF